MPTAYSPAPQVQRIAEELIRQYHHHLLHADLRYVFRDKASKSGAHHTLGKARRVSGLNAFLGTGETDDNETPVPFFVIEIAEDTWQELTDGQQKALVDHELMHCNVELSEKDGTPKLTIRKHDLEEFRDIVQRHGLWQPELANFVAAARQTSLFDGKGEILDVAEEPEAAEPSGIDAARAALEEPSPPRRIEASTGEITSIESPPEEINLTNGDTSQPQPQEEPVTDQTADMQEKPEPQVADLAQLDGERIEPEPIPAEALAAARPQGEGPKVIHFDPNEVADLQPPAPTEREPLHAGARKRDSALESFLNE